MYSTVRYFSAFLKDIFETLYNHNVTDFIKETYFLQSTLVVFVSHISLQLNSLDYASTAVLPPLTTGGGGIMLSDGQKSCPSVRCPSVNIYFT